MPTKSKLIYLAPAQQDMAEIVKYHAVNVGSDSARKIYQTMRDAITGLQNFPLMGQTHPDPLLAMQGYRKLVLNDTHVAIYKIIDGVVTIYRIVNGRTDYPKLLR